VSGVATTADAPAHCYVSGKVSPTPTSIERPVAVGSHGKQMERQYAHRVVCPTCGSWAQLRVAYRDQWPPRVVVFSCVNQTEACHLPPSRDALLGLIPTGWPLPEIDEMGHLPW
jgi:hypothetical protein